jgi:hypothetical protein
MSLLLFYNFNDCSFWINHGFQKLRCHTVLLSLCNSAVKGSFDRASNGRINLVQIDDDEKRWGIVDRGEEEDVLAHPLGCRPIPSLSTKVTSLGDGQSFRCPFLLCSTISYEKKCDVCPLRVGWLPLAWFKRIRTYQVSHSKLKTGFFCV